MNDFIKIKGKRLNYGLLDKSTVKITLNANVGKLLKVFQKDNAIDMNHLEIRPEKELLDMFLVLEKGIYNLEQTSTSVEISDVDDLKNKEDYLKASEQLSDDCATKILDMALLKSEAGLVPDPFVRKGESVVIVDSSRKIPSLETILDNKKNFVLKLYSKGKKTSRKPNIFKACGMFSIHSSSISPLFVLNIYV